MPKENMSKLGIHRVTCQKVFLKTFKKLDLIGTNILTPLPTHPPHTHTHTHTQATFVERLYARSSFQKLMAMNICMFWIF